MDAADVVVSIVNHENREMVLRCLDALAGADPPGCRISIVVLDNASTDGSVAAIQSAHPEVAVLAQRHRAGFGANHNAVIRSTRSRYVYLLNDDAFTTRADIARLVDYADRHPAAAAVGPRLTWPDGRAQPSAFRFPTPGAAIAATPTLGRRGVVQSGGDGERRVDWLTGAALLLRREALDRVGLFDEAFFMYAEETDLERRLADAGWEARLDPELTVVHVGQGSSAGVPTRRIDEQWRSRHLYWRKHHSRAGHATAAGAYALQYALRSLIARLLARLRPGSVGASDAEQYALHARLALRGASGPGLAELAEEFNAQPPKEAPTA